MPIIVVSASSVLSRGFFKCVETNILNFALKSTLNFLLSIYFLVIYFKKTHVTLRKFLKDIFSNVLNYGR
jgi:hypothetical protein